MILPPFFKLVIGFSHLRLLKIAGAVHPLNDLFGRLGIAAMIAMGLGIAQPQVEVFRLGLSSHDFCGFVHVRVGIRVAAPGTGAHVKARHPAHRYRHVVCAPCAVAIICPLHPVHPHGIRRLGNHPAHVHRRIPQIPVRARQLQRQVALDHHEIRLASKPRPVRHPQRDKVRPLGNCNPQG